MGDVTRSLRLDLAMMRRGIALIIAAHAIAGVGAASGQRGRKELVVPIAGIVAVEQNPPGLRIGVPVAER